MHLSLKRGGEIIKTKSGEANTIRGLSRLLRFNGADLVFRVAQDRLFDVSGGGDAARGVVSRFLQQVTGVPARPFPMNFVRRRGAIQSLPPRQIRLASKTAVHRFDHISRISKHTHLARLSQRFEPNRRRRDFSLLVRRLA